jgi:hypothetical protein
MNISINWRGVIAIVLLALAMVTTSIVAANLGTEPRASVEPTATPTPDATPSTDARAAASGAKELKQTLSTDGYNSTVMIGQRGDIVVQFQPRHANGPAHKADMRRVAHHYSDALVNQRQMGGLTVESGGVTMLASRDTAMAHGNGDIRNSAFNKTLHFTSTKR